MKQGTILFVSEYAEYSAQVMREAREYALNKVLTRLLDRPPVILSGYEAITKNLIPGGIL